MGLPNPCFFGIIPEKTAFYQAVAIFNWLHEPLSPWSEPNSGFYHSGFFSNDLGLEVILEKEYGSVKNVILRISLNILYRGGTAYPHVQVWPAFLPNILINKYGIPSRVEFNIGGSHDMNAPSSFYYNMYVYFAPVNLTIAYQGGAFPDDGSPKVCPLTDQFTNLEVW